MSTAAAGSPAAAMGAAASPCARPTRRAPPRRGGCQVPEPELHGVRAASAAISSDERLHGEPVGDLAGGADGRGPQRRVGNPVHDRVHVRVRVRRIDVLVDQAGGAALGPARCAPRPAPATARSAGSRSTPAATRASPTPRPRRARPRRPAARGAAAGPWVQAVLVLPHPLHAHRPAGRLREQRRLARGVLGAVLAVRAGAVHVHDAHALAPEPEDARERRLNWCVALRRRSRSWRGPPSPRPRRTTARSSRGSAPATGTSRRAFAPPGPARERGEVAPLGDHLVADHRARVHRVEQRRVLRQRPGPGFHSIFRRAPRAPRPTRARRRRPRSSPSRTTRAPGMAAIDDSSTAFTVAPGAGGRITRACSMPGSLSRGGSGGGR